MKRKGAIVRLYYLLIHADGVVNERELMWGTAMSYLEGFEQEEFRKNIEDLSSLDDGEIYSDALGQMLMLSKPDQVRIVAWLCVIANSDGFMDAREWKFIYKLYQHELGLVLSDILQEQVRIINSVSLKTLSNFTHRVHVPEETGRATLP